MKEVSVLFVCMGNICRSPLAEGIFRKHVPGLLKDHAVDTDSAGTIAYHSGEQPDPRSREVAARNGIHLSHRARQIQEEDFSRFNYILAMDAQNLKEIMAFAKSRGLDSSRVYMFREWDPEGTGDVPDPYYGGPDGFTRIFTMIERTIIGFCKWLKEEPA